MSFIGFPNRLRIPDLNRGDEINSRLQFIFRFNLCTSDEYHHLTIAIAHLQLGLNVPKETDLKSLIRRSTKGDLQIDFYDRLVLSLDFFLFDLEEDNTDRLLKYVNSPNQKIKSHAKAKLIISNYVKNVEAKGLSRIRAKFALKELLVHIYPEVFCPDLVDLSPTYLASLFIQQIILNEKENLLQNRSKKSENILINIGKAIRGDKNKVKPRKNYFFIFISQTIIENYVTNIRRYKLLNQDEQRKQCYLQLIEKFNISSELLGHLYSKNYSASRFAKEVLLERFPELGPKSFENSKSEVKRIILKLEEAGCYDPINGRDPLFLYYIEAENLYKPSFFYSPSIFSRLALLDFDNHF